MRASRAFKPKAWFQLSMPALDRGGKVDLRQLGVLLADRLGDRGDGPDDRLAVGVEVPLARHLDDLAAVGRPVGWAAEVVLERGQRRGEVALALAVATQGQTEGAGHPGGLFLGDVGDDGDQEGLEPGEDLVEGGPVGELAEALRDR